MTVNKVDKDTVLETLSIYRSFYLSLAVLVFIYLHLYVNLYLYMSVYLSNIGKCIVMGLWVIFHVCALLYFLSFLNCSGDTPCKSHGDRLTLASCPGFLS